MRFVKGLGMLLCLFVLGSVALGAANKMGIREVRNISFDTPVRVGETVLPAGQYVVRHTMAGEEHIMVFQRAGHAKTDIKVKCTLVPLTEKANQATERFTRRTRRTRGRSARIGVPRRYGQARF